VIIGRPSGASRRLLAFACLALGWAMLAAPLSAQVASDTSSLEALLTQAQELGAEQPDAAIVLLEAALNDAGQAQQGELSLALANLLIQREQPERAFEILAGVDVGRMNDPQARAQLLKLRIATGTSLRNSDLVDRNRDDVESLPPDALEPEVLAGLWHQQLVAHFRRGQPAEAESAARNGLKALGDKIIPLRGTLQEHLGISLAQQGQLPDAIEAMLEAERLNNQLGVPLRADFLGNFGGLFIYTQDWPRAIDYLSRTLAMHHEQGSPPEQIARTLSNLGVAYNGSGDLAEATIHFESALQVSRDAGLRIGSAVNNLAYALREQGRLDEALAMFEEALKVGESERNAEIIAVAQKNLGETLVRLGRREQAALYLEQAHQGYLKADVRPKRLELYPVLIENLEALGRTADALRMLHEFKALSDETITVDSNERIARLESAIDLARKEQELAVSEGERLRQEADLVVLQADRQRQRIVAIGLLVVLVALGLIALLLYRQVRFKTRANRLLQEKNAEIQQQHARMAELNETIHQQSRHDALTGLPNRRFLEEHMRAVSAPDAPNSKSTGLLLMIDIDHFKRINDTLGHLAGDQALVHLAGVIARCSQPGDVVVRWGGEEFLWLAHGATLEQAPSLCRRLQDQLRQHPFEHAGQTHPITVSLGFAPRPLWPMDGCDWTLSLRVADDALYVAKQAGRNRWVGFAPGEPPALPLGQGAVASALESTGHLIRIEGSTAIGDATNATEPTAPPSPTGSGP